MSKQLQNKTNKLQSLIIEHASQDRAQSRANQHRLLALSSEFLTDKKTVATVKSALAPPVMTTRPQSLANSKQTFKSKVTKTRFSDTFVPCVSLAEVAKSI